MASYPSSTDGALLALAESVKVSMPFFGLVAACSALLVTVSQGAEVGMQWMP